jgi:hypothetical protein
MPFMLRVRMRDGSERLAYLADESRQSADVHAGKLLSQDGIEAVEVEDYSEEPVVEAPPMTGPTRFN